MAALNNSKSDDITVMMELIKSIKEDYKTLESGLKPRPTGRTNQQLKANSTKDMGLKLKCQANQAWEQW
jgi:hypothetical protein